MQSSPPVLNREEQNVKNNVAVIKKAKGVGKEVGYQLTVDSNAF